MTDALAELGDPASPEAVALMLELAVDGVYGLRFPQIAELAGKALRPPGRWAIHPSLPPRPPRWRGAQRCVVASPTRRGTAKERPPWSTGSRTETWP